MADYRVYECRRAEDDPESSRTIEMVDPSTAAEEFVERLCFDPDGPPDDYYVAVIVRDVETGEEKRFDVQWNWYVSAAAYEHEEAPDA